MSEGNRHWDRNSALDQIEQCHFVCEAGPLEQNVAWQWLRTALEIGPRYLPGQGVWFRVSATANGVTLAEWRHFYVVGVRMDSGTDDRFWTYSLSNDPPAPYHCGTVNFSGVSEDQLQIERAAADA